MDEKAEIEIVLKHLSVLRIEPGDTLVFRTPGSVSVAACERFRTVVREAFPGLPDLRMIVLEGDMELAVLRPTPDPGG